MLWRRLTPAASFPKEIRLEKKRQPPPPHSTLSVCLSAAQGRGQVWPGGCQCAGLAWAWPRFTPPRTCHNLPVLSSCAHRAGGWELGPSCQGEGNWGALGGLSRLSLKSPCWDPGPGWHWVGGLGTAGHPLPLSALTPRGWAAGAVQPQGCSWGQLGHPGARSCLLALARGRHQSDAIPWGRSIPGHPRGV